MAVTVEGVAEPAVRTVATALAVALLAVGCGDAAPPVDDPAVGQVEIATEVDEALLAPLEAFGPCPEPPQATAEVADVPGLRLPEGARVTAASTDGPLSTVEGWIPLTPIGVRADFVTSDDFDVEYSVLNVEDEVFESETLLTDGDHRLFIKAQAICRTESIFVAQIIPEDGSEPAPLGQGG